jgi:hypothetical protein
VLEYLIGVCKTTHTRHHTENVVVHGVYFDGVVGVYAREVKSGVVNTGHVAGTRGLMFFGFEGEGVNVDATGLTVHSGDTFVMLEGLYKLEVLGYTGGETFVTVELEFGGVVGGNVGTDISTVFFLNPDDFLAGVVEVEFNFGGGGFVTGELELFNEVLVGDLGETATFVSVEVDVIDVEGSGGKGARGSINEDVITVTEFEVDLDFVVLEGNKGKGKTRIAAEPELKRYENNIVGNIRGTGGVFSEDITTVNHKFVTIPVTGGLGKFVPDVEPVSVVFVNTLATNFYFYRFNKFVASPCNTFGGKLGLEVNAVDKITISGDGASYLLAEVGETIESLFNRFHREVSVSAVDNFEKSDLRVSR